MVSFWPWKGDENSPASFEKTLSSLSAKISKTSARLDGLRQRARRYSVLWTLYAGFAYLLYTIILALVVGWRQWGPGEYVAVAGGPLLIYFVRLGLSKYYEYRTASIQTHLDGLQQHRDATIEKLKTATKYNSTQELLKKYSGVPNPKAKTAGASDQKGVAKQIKAPEKLRTSFVPPPTANIRRVDGESPLHNPLRGTAPQPKSPSERQLSMSSTGPPQISQESGARRDSSAEFAPNAFAAPPQYMQNSESSRWYDRLMDVLLGEDETRPGARLALICNNCHLVNGQAPPGVKHLEDLGKWRCGGCGATNGEEIEARKIIANIERQKDHETELRGKETAKRTQSLSQYKNGDAESTLMDHNQEKDMSPSSAETSEGEDDQSEIPAISEKKSDPPRRRSTRSTKGKAEK